MKHTRTCPALGLPSEFASGIGKLGVLEGLLPLNTLYVLFGYLFDFSCSCILYSSTGSHFFFLFLQSQGYPRIPRFHLSLPKKSTDRVLFSVIVLRHDIHDRFAAFLREWCTLTSLNQRLCLVLCYCSSL
jgi:hypothetical protein